MATAIRTCLLITGGLYRLVNNKEAVKITRKNQCLGNSSQSLLSFHLELNALNFTNCLSRVFSFTFVMHVKFTHNIVLGRNLEILLLLKPGRDRSVTAAKVSNTS
jgi:hypothetical protein